MLIVLCGGFRSKLGGQDRRWLKVANMLSDLYGCKIIMNESYYKLGCETEIEPPKSASVVKETGVKFADLLMQNIIVVRNGLKERCVYFSSNALSGAPAALLLFALGKKIAFSFNGVSVNYLFKYKNRKLLFILWLMNRIAHKIELLNETTSAENFFNNSKVFLSDAMYAGNNPALIEKNRRKIVFAGNFLELKGVGLLRNVIKNRSEMDWEFHVYGGELGVTEESTRKAIEELRSEMNVIFHGHVDDMSIAYSDAAVVLSLQEISNYPSQVVLEALVNGCSVVITRTGDSERFGCGPGIFYVSESFDSTEYWNAIAVAAEFSLRNASKISSCALEKFKPEDYVANFYLKIQ